MATIEQARSYRDQIGKKFKGKRWLLGVGIIKGDDPDDYGVKINVSRFPIFCRIPGEGKIKIVMEKTTMTEPQVKEW